MNIVANNYMLRFFKKINIFTVDLGSNLKGPVQQKNTEGIKIKDEFIKKYQHLTGTIVRKYGNIGRLAFYEDGTIGMNEFHIFDNEKIYEIEVTKDDLLKLPGVYLTEILQKIENIVVTEENDISVTIIKDVAYSNMSDDIVRPNMKLPKDQFIESLINRRRLLEKTN